jgi:Phosphoglycerate dehydrogenase and related dehydrogenases
MRPIAHLLAALSPIELRDFLPEPLLGELRSLTRDFQRFDPTAHSPEEFYRTLADANPEVLVAAWKTPLLPARLPPNLRYVCYLCGSVKKLVTREHLERGLLVTNWGGSISRIVAEWALFHTLCGLRRASYWSLAMHLRGAWKDTDTTTASLFGRRVGLHGFGMVAREFVKLLAPFGCTISVHAPDVDDAVAAHWGIRAEPSLETLFSDNDIIVELAPLIPETEGIVTESLLRRIRPGGVFVNLGRGAVVDEAALIAVAREGQVCFGLDVYETEPLPADHPLRGLPNVMLTPHIGGPTTDRRRDAGAFAVKNLRAYAAGEPLEALVTPEVFAVTS